MRLKVNFNFESEVIKVTDLSIKEVCSIIFSDVNLVYFANIVVLLAGLAIIVP